VVGCRVFPKQREVHKPGRKTDWPVVEIPVNKVVVEFDSKPVHRLQKDLLSKSEHYKVKFSDKPGLVIQVRKKELCYPHSMITDLLDRAFKEGKEYELQLMSLVYTIHDTGLVLSMHDEERCTYLNHS